MPARDKTHRSERKKATERLLAATSELEDACLFPHGHTDAAVKVAAFEEAYRAFIRLNHSVSVAPSRRLESVRLLMCTMLAADTLGEAMQLLVRFAPLLLRSRGPCALKHTSSGVLLVLRLPQRSDIVALASEIWSLSLYLRVFEALIDGRLEGVVGQLRVDASFAVPEATRLFEGDLHYGSAELALRIPRHHLERAVVATREQALSFSPKLVPSFAVSHDAQPTLAPVVAALVRRALLTQSSATAHLTLVAKRLGVSETTLRRRLTAEGTSFRALKDDVVNELARNWLRDPTTSVEAIAERLGFSDAPAFRRSFRRVNGCPPIEFRNRTAR